MKTNDTITAIATPRGTGGVSMVRISGPDAADVACKVMRRSAGELRSRIAAYGDIYDGDEKIDDGMLTYFKSPNSYTGEDTAEITCHGGIYVTDRVLRACIDAGARLAEPGEFTKRALLNGKLTLTQAESVIDIINAGNKQYLSCSLAQRDGALYHRLEEISHNILDISAQIAAWIDYPDEALDSFETSSFLGQLADCRTKLQLMLESYDIGRIMREGIVTSIVGKPNAGKSTVMNLLTKTERSIVTEIAGTTRDIVEESVNIGDVVLRLCDCAGLRQAGDKVEEIGVSIMLRRLEQSELALAVFDNSKPLEQDDYTLVEKLKGKNVICVINKADLENKLDLTYLATKFGEVIEISAKDPSSFEPLTSLISRTLRLNRIDMSMGFIANERQRECARRAEKLLGRAIGGITAGMTLDTLGVTLESALESLYELSGKNMSETVIDEVFRRFCVGK